MNQKCSSCNGTGKCKNCGGNGKKVAICRRCMGRKTFDKESAQKAYGLYLSQAIDLMRGLDVHEDSAFKDIDSRKKSAKEVHDREVATVISKNAHLDVNKERGPAELSADTYMTTLSGPKPAHGGGASSGGGKKFDVAWEKAMLKWEIEDLKSKGASPEEIEAAKQRFRDKAREAGVRLLDHKPVIIREVKGGRIRDIVIDDGGPVN